MNSISIIRIQIQKYRNRIMENYLLILNDSPYGTERPYNALRLALSLLKRENTQVKVFLTGDAVICARKNQKTPEGYYNIERMIRSIAARGKVAT